MNTPAQRDMAIYLTGSWPLLPLPELRLTFPSNFRTLMVFSHGLNKQRRIW